MSFPTQTCSSEYDVCPNYRWMEDHHACSRSQFVELVEYSNNSKHGFPIVTPKYENLCPLILDVAHKRLGPQGVATLNAQNGFYNCKVGVKECGFLLRIPDHRRFACSESLNVIVGGDMYYAYPVNPKSCKLNAKKMQESKPELVQITANTVQEICCSLSINGELVDAPCDSLNTDNPGAPICNHHPKNILCIEAKLSGPDQKVEKKYYPYGNSMLNCKYYKQIQNSESE